MKSKVEGGTKLRRLLRSLPEEARGELVGVLDDYGTKLLAAMKRDVPVQTGELRSRLSKSKVTKSSLALRVGFVGKRANGPKRRGKRKVRDEFQGDAFYGRFVEFGRKAQTVSVTRLRKGGRAAWRERIASGAGRLANKPADLVVRYQLRVRARAARPYVYKRRPELRRQMQADLSAKFDRLLARTAAGGY